MVRYSVVRYGILRKLSINGDFLSATHFKIPITALMFSQEAVASFRKYYCLVGLVVKASASRAEDPGFESRLRRDFSGVESYQ